MLKAKDWYLAKALRTQRKTVVKGKRLVSREGAKNAEKGKNVGERLKAGEMWFGVDKV